MQAFTVRVEGHKPGMPVIGAEFTVNAENESVAAELAKLDAREMWLKHQGIIPIVRGVLPKGAKFEQDPSTNAPSAALQGEEPARAKEPTPAEFEDLQPERQIKARPYAIWRAMKPFRLMAYARKAVHGLDIKVPDTKTALRLLQERNLVAP